MNREAYRERIIRMLSTFSTETLRHCYFFALGLSAADKKKPAGAATPTSNEKNNASVLYTKGA